MKANFLRQISRMLVFSMFLTSFPVNILKASSTTSSGTSSTTAPACPNGFNFNKGAGCSIFEINPANGLNVTNYSAASCNLNVGAAGSCISSLASPNSPKTISNYGISSINGYNYNDSTALPNIYQTTTSNLLAAIHNYNTLVNSYMTYSALHLSIITLMLDLMIDNSPYNSTTDPSGYTTSLLPIMPSGASSNVTSAFQYNKYGPKGDFLPINTATGYDASKMMAGFINYLATGDNQTYYSNILSALIIYSLLDSNINPVTKVAYTYNDFVESLIPFFGNYEQNNPLTGASMQRTPAEMAEYLQNAKIPFKSNALGVLTVVSGAAPTIVASGALNLLINLAQTSSGGSIDWSSIYSDPTQLAVLTGIAASVDPSSSSFQAVFPVTTSKTTDSSSYVIYLLNAFKAIANNNLYFRCDIDTNSNAMDTSIYLNNGVPTSVTIKLSDQFQNDQIASFTANNPGKKPSDLISMPSDIPDTVFNYKVGDFYFWLPSEAILGQGNLSALQLSGLEPSQGSLWGEVCSTSSSSTMYEVENGLLKALNTLTQAQENATPDNAAPGVAIYEPNTIEGVSSNLIIAAQAAISQPPITFTNVAAVTGVTPTTASPAPSDASPSNYSWINDTYSSIYNPSIISLDKTVKVNPILLNNFMPQTTIENDSPTFFASQDHMNMLLDLTKIRQAYSQCWENLSICGNVQAAPSPDNPGYDCESIYNPNVNIGIIHVHDGVDLFSRRCFNNALGSAIGKALASPVGIAMLSILMGGGAIFGVIKLRIMMIAKAQIAAAQKPRIETEAEAEARIAADIEAGTTVKPIEIPTPSGPGDVPVNVNPYGPGRMGPPVSNRTYQELQASVKDINEDLETFSTLDSYDRLSLKSAIEQNIVDFEAQVKAGNTEAQEDLDDAIDQASTFNMNLDEFPYKPGEPVISDIPIPVGV